MPDSPPPEEIARLDAEIAEAKRKLATLRHEGERHYIDDVAVDPAVTDALHEVVGAGERYRQARVSHPAPPPARTDPLADLQSRIEHLRKLSEDPHQHEQHFVDG